MFNGIVESIGKIKNVSGASGKQDAIHLTVASELPLSDLNIGDSIAVNGVCLTITKLFKAHNSFSLTVVPETLRLTNLGDLQINDGVNLERSLKMIARISGHYVQGHVDAMGVITKIAADGDQAILVTMQTTPAITKYIVKKGYVALDGMSITVVDVGKTHFTVTFIPHTQNITIVKQYIVGSKINIEVDMMAKYIEKLIR